jgi:hypothetical protein
MRAVESMRSGEVKTSDSITSEGHAYARRFGIALGVALGAGLCAAVEIVGELRNPISSAEELMTIILCTMVAAFAGGYVCALTQRGLRGLGRSARW